MRCQLPLPLMAQASTRLVWGGAEPLLWVSPLQAHKAQGFVGKKEPEKMIPKKASKGSTALNVAKNNETNLKK